MWPNCSCNRNLSNCRLNPKKRFRGFSEIWTCGLSRTTREGECGTWTKHEEWLSSPFPTLHACRIWIQAEEGRVQDSFTVAFWHMPKCWQLVKCKQSCISVMLSHAIRHYGSFWVKSETSFLQRTSIKWTQSIYNSIGWVYRSRLLITVLITNTYLT